MSGKRLYSIVAIIILLLVVSLPGCVPTQAPTSSPIRSPALTPPPATAKAPVATSTTPSSPVPFRTPILPPTPSPTVANVFYAQVTRVIDGDTIEVDIGGKHYTLRYIGIDTPETVHPSKPVQPFGPDASNKNKELVGGKVVRLEKDVSETDKYGRLLRYVYIGDLFINAELVRLGYAQVSTYPPDVKYTDLFLKLQREAREAGRGLWGSASATPAATTTKPSSTPIPATTTDGGKFVGSKNSNVYHYPSCRYAGQINTENLIWFNSVEEAQAKGYRACNVCKPPG